MRFLGCIFQNRRRLKILDDKIEIALIKLDIIMASQSELTARINAASTQLQKISAESSATLAKVKELQDLLDKQGDVSPELQQAVDNLAAQIQAVDDLTPDLTDGSSATSTGVGSSSGSTTGPGA